MNTTDRAPSIVASILIGLGVLFLVFNLTGLSFGETWPIIFFLLAAGFYLPAILWPDNRRELAGLFIPGSVLLTLGLIFFYNTFTHDWASWAYAWILIPGGVGLGLALAALVGRWGSGTLWIGVWMMIGSLIVFGFFGTLFGGTWLRSIGPALLIAGGILLLVRTMRR